jgi:hypothetical protein
MLRASGWVVNNLNPLKPRWVHNYLCGDDLANTSHGGALWKTLRAGGRVPAPSIFEDAGHGDSGGDRERRAGLKPASFL